MEERSPVFVYSKKKEKEKEKEEEETTKWKKRKGGSEGGRRTEAKRREGKIATRAAFREAVTLIALLKSQIKGGISAPPTLNCPRLPQLSRDRQGGSL